MKRTKMQRPAGRSAIPILKSSKSCEGFVLTWSVNLKKIPNENKKKPNTLKCPTY